MPVLSYFFIVVFKEIVDFPETIENDLHEFAIMPKNASKQPILPMTVKNTVLDFKANNVHALHVSNQPTFDQSHRLVYVVKCHNCGLHSSD